MNFNLKASSINVKKVSMKKRTIINATVTADLKNDFKAFCANEGVTMSHALKWCMCALMSGKEEYKIKTKEKS